MLETALHHWQDGERRFALVPPSERRAFERVIERITSELRWRLGTSFTIDELVELYEGSQAWTLALAHEIAPAQPLAWEHWVSAAAFGAHMHRARDYPRRASGAPGG